MTVYLYYCHEWTLLSHSVPCHIRVGRCLDNKNDSNKGGRTLVPAEMALYSTRSSDPLPHFRFSPPESPRSTFSDRLTPSLRGSVHPYLHRPYHSFPEPVSPLRDSRTPSPVLTCTSVHPRRTGVSSLWCRLRRPSLLSGKVETPRTTFNGVKHSTFSVVSPCLHRLSGPGLGPTSQHT